MPRFLSDSNPSFAATDLHEAREGPRLERHRRSPPGPPRLQPHAPLAKKKKSGIKANKYHFETGEGVVSVLFCLFSSSDHPCASSPREQHAQRHSRGSKLHRLNHFGKAQLTKEARSSSSLKLMPPCIIYIFIVSFAFKSLPARGDLAHRAHIPL